MGRIERFEDLEVWQSARKLVSEVYRISRRAAFSRDISLRDQIRRAAVSSMANVAEGFERGGNREFSQYLAQAKASAGEVRSHLYAALDQSSIEPEEFESLTEMASNVSRMAAGLMRYLQRSRLRGSKYQ
jgi:four helix bundle protein